MKLLLTALLALISFTAFAQADTTIQRLEKKLAAAKTVSDKLDVIGELAQNYNLENPAACQQTLDNGIYIAEQSRDREMMAKAHRTAGLIYSQMSGLKEYSVKAENYLKEALNICEKESGMETEKISCYMTMARLLRNLGRQKEAQKKNEEAMNIAAETGNDSLLVVTRLGYGRTQLAAGEKLEAFKNILLAQEVADKSNHPNKDWLEITCFNSLAAFYSSIEDYDKAIDYQYKSLAYAKKNNNQTDVFSTLNSIGNSYIAAKKFGPAKKIYEEVIQLGDSLKQPDYKTQGQIGVVNTLMNGPDNKQTIQYMYSHPEIKILFERLHMEYQLDFGMAQVYANIKNYDSAGYFYNLSLPTLEKVSSRTSLPGIYQVYAKFLYETSNYKKAIDYLLRAKAITDSSANTDSNVDYYQMLDSCYQRVSDYKNAFYYNSLYNKAKKDVEEKSKQKDVLALEIDAENKRKERQIKEAEEETIRRHNWQYMGIVLGIVSLFIVLAALGLFRVPLRWVRILGFISFIFLFEFIILLADKWIHHATHGEPWKILAIKVVLIAILLPLHHFLEHKAIHYISQRLQRKATKEVAAS